MTVYILLGASFLAALALAAWRDRLRHQARVDAITWRAVAEADHALAEGYCAMWQAAQAEAERAR